MSARRLQDEPGQKTFIFDLRIHNFILAQRNTTTRDKVCRSNAPIIRDRSSDFIFATLSFPQFLEGFF